MEVTQIKDHDTHAVLGGGKAQAFSISQSAEFFTVLSDTLYRDKKLAVVREVMCNAWDANTMVDRQDVPIEVIISKRELRISDSGPGIPPSKIADIYCTYGNSTKVADDSQTGGFGLGSKAPFAYTSHLTVKNRHNGKETIYAISRGSSETDGRPDIREIVTVPTELSGVEVIIPIAEQDGREFLRLASMTARRGNIRARIKATGLGISAEENYTIDPVDLSLASEDGFFVLNDNGAASLKDTGYGAFESRVNIMLGAVIYPVTTQDSTISSLVTRISTLLPVGATRASIVIPAAPGSLGVSPSREFLSYTDRTKKEVTRLLTYVIARLEKQAAEVDADFRADYMTAVLSTTDPKKLSSLLDSPRVSVVRFYPRHLPQWLNPREVIAADMLYRRSFINFDSTDLKAVQAQILDHILKTFPQNAPEIKFWAKLYGNGGYGYRSVFETLKSILAHRQGHERLLLRAMNPLMVNRATDVATNVPGIYYSYDERWTFEGLIKHDVTNIIVAPSIKAGQAQGRRIAADIKLAKEWIDNSQLGRFVTITRSSITPAIHGELMARNASFEAHDIPIKVHVMCKVMEKKKKKRGSYTAFRSIADCEGRGEPVIGVNMTCTEPLFYIPLEADQSTLTHSHVEKSKRVRAFAEIFPGAVVTHGIRELRRALKANVPHYSLWLVRHLAENAKAIECALAISFAVLESGHYKNTPLAGTVFANVTVHNIIQAARGTGDYRFLKEILGAKDFDVKAFDRWMLIAQVAKHEFQREVRSLDGTRLNVFDLEDLFDVVNYPKAMGVYDKSKSYQLAEFITDLQKRIQAYVGRVKPNTEWSKVFTTFDLNSPQFFEIFKEMNAAYARLQKRSQKEKKA